MIHFRCRACHEPLEARDAEAGRSGLCPHCGAAYRVPKARALPPSLERGGARSTGPRERGIEAFFLAVGMVLSAAMGIVCAAGWLYGIALAFRTFEGFAIAALAFLGFCWSAALFIVFRKVRRL